MKASELVVPPDTVIGRWKVREKLGGGGQGSVWLVKPTSSKHSPFRALKICLAEDQQGRARFEREIELLHRCDSPYVLRVFDHDLSWKQHVAGLPPLAYYVSEKHRGSLESRQRELGDARRRARAEASRPIRVAAAAHNEEDEDEHHGIDRPATEPRELTFVPVVPDRSDMSRYVHLIRDKSDPERAQRGPIPTPFAWRRINDAPPEQWADAIVAHLTDGMPRTFNRIALELTTMTADVAFDTTLDKGLWLAVGAGRLLLTLEAPIFFMAAQSET